MFLKTYTKTSNKNKICNHLSCRISSDRVNFSHDYTIPYQEDIRNMTSEPERKLAAIMFTDIIGHTDLMQNVENKAREMIQRHSDSVKPCVEIRNKPDITATYPGEKNLKMFCTHYLYSLIVYPVFIFYVKIIMIKGRAKELRDSQLW